MHPRFFQLTLLVFVGLFLAFLIPFVGPAVREMALVPDGTDLVAQRTSAPASDILTASREGDKVRKLNLKDARTRAKAKQDFANDKATLARLSVKIAATRAKAPPAPAPSVPGDFEGDVVSVEELNRASGLSVAEQRSYLTAATRVKSFLLTAAAQADDSHVFEEGLKGIFDASSLAADKELVLQAVEFGIGNVEEWQEKRTAYEPLRAWLKALITNPNESESVRRAAVAAFVTHPILPPDIPFAIALFKGQAVVPALTLRDKGKLDIIGGIYAFLPEYQAGLEFLKEQSQSSDPVIQGAALSQLMRQAHPANGDSELKSRVENFLNQHPDLKQKAQAYRVPEPKASSLSQDVNSAAFLAQAGPQAAACEPVPETGLIRIAGSGLGGGVELQVPGQRELPQATESDFVSGPKGYPLSLRGARGWNGRTGSQSYSMTVELINKSQWNGTSGDTPQFGAVKQDDACLMIVPEELQRCAVSYSGGGPSNPRPAPRVRVRKPSLSPTPTPPICGNGFVEPPEACDPPGTPCSAPGVHNGACTPACQCQDIFAPGKSPLPLPPPGGSDVEPSMPSAPNGGLLRQGPEPNTSFLAQVSGPGETGTRDPFQALYENPQPRSQCVTAATLTWEGTPPDPVRPYASWSEGLGCDAIVAKTFDGAAAADVRFTVDGFGSGEVHVPTDTDRDGLPDLYEAMTEVIDPTTGRKTRLNACNPRTLMLGEQDAQLDVEVDRCTWDPRGEACNRFPNRQTAIGDGFTEWDVNYRGVVIFNGPVTRAQNGTVVKLVSRVGEMPVEEGKAEGRTLAVAGIKKLFIKGIANILFSMLPGERIPNSILREFGIQAIVPEYTDPWADSQEVTIERRPKNYRIGGLIGAINFVSAADPEAVAKGFVKGPHAGILLRTGEISDLALTVTRTLPPENPYPVRLPTSVDDYYSPDIPPEKVLGLPIIFSLSNIDSDIDLFSRHISGFDRIIYRNHIAMHEIAHKGAGSVHPIRQAQYARDMVDYAAVRDRVDTASFPPDDHFYFIKKREGSIYKYYIGAWIKAEAYEPLQAFYYYVPSIPPQGTPPETIMKLLEKPRWNLDFGGFGRNEYFVPPRFQNSTNDIRVWIFRLLEVLSQEPTPRTIETLEQWFGNPYLFLSHLDPFVPDAGGYFFDLFGGSVLLPRAMQGSPVEYPWFDPARRFHR